MRNLLVRANTATTVFRVDLQDENNITRMNYSFHKGELRDDNIAFPMVGEYTINITNASPNDTFRIICSVQEN